VRMVTIMECGRLIRLAWINGALVRLSELQSQLESQKASREQREDVCTASVSVSAAGNAPVT
jgi:hypothetical protein